MAMKKLRALPSPFPSSVFMHVKCKESRDAWAKRCEQQRFPGTAAFGMAGSLCSSVLLVYLQHPPSPIRVQEGFTVRNYPGGWLPESINHAPISTLFFSSKPSFKLQHTRVLWLLANTWHGLSYGPSQVSQALGEVAHGGLTAGHGNHQVRTQDCH